MRKPVDADELERRYLKQTVEAKLQPFAARMTTSWPKIIIDGKIVQTFLLMLHELTTNATK